MSESITRAPGGVTRDIVQKLWRLCDILRDDGITYQAYVTELTYLLFLKMLAETGREGPLPADARWASLTSRQGEALLTQYRALLLRLGTEGAGMIRTIFADAQTSLRKPTNLHELVTQIDRLDWYSAKAEGLGDLYEKCHNVFSHRGCWKRMPPRRNPAPGSISPRVR